MELQQGVNTTSTASASLSLFCVMAYYTSQLFVTLMLRTAAFVAHCLEFHGFCHALLQGLHATVNVLDAELVSIDREQQGVVLSDQRKVLYGLLLLTVGLERTADLAEQPHEHASSVLSAQQLLQNMPKVSCMLLGKLQVL